MGTRTKLLATLALVGACGVLAIPSIAAATPSGVTIHHRGHQRLYGFVFSPEPRKCAKDRTVRIFRQVGEKQNPERDGKTAKQQTHKASGGKYKWTFGQRGLRGHFYALISKVGGCKGDTSPTIKIFRHH